MSAFLVGGLALAAWILLGRRRPGIIVSTDCGTVTEEEGWFDRVYGPRMSDLQAQFALDESLRGQYFDWALRTILLESGVPKHCLDWYPWLDQGWTGSQWSDRELEFERRFPELYALIRRAREPWYGPVRGGISVE